MKLIRDGLLYIFLLLIGGKETMAIIYATLICKNLMTIDDVFPVIRQQVIDYLAALGVPGYTAGYDVVDTPQ